jgi:tRNA threonylcarbamoyladenosine biosynthesis protein TsaE
MGSEHLSQSEAETFEFARKVAESLEVGAHILLFGELGAGKTAFTRGLAAGLGMDDVDEVSSPTFTLVNRYQGPVTIYHIDLYRVAAGDLHDLGLDEILEDPRAVTVIEWAERLGDFTPPGAIRMFLSYVDAHTRRIEIED